MESDPIGLAGASYYTYTYVNGSPVIASDPRGLLVEVIGHPAAAPFGRITNPTSFHEGVCQNVPNVAVSCG